MAYRTNIALKVRKAECLALVQVQQEAESLRQGLDQFQEEALGKMRQSLKEVGQNPKP